MPEETPHYISPDQLCVGLYIHLDLTWMDHPFTFSSFKIKNEEQIATIRTLGLKRLRYSPAKSDAFPLQLTKPVDTSSANEPVPVALSEEAQEQRDAKQVRLYQLKQQRAAIEACEKDFLATAQTIHSLDQNVYARPKESAAAAQHVVDSMLDSLITDKDIAIHLMNEHGSSEQTYYHSLNVAVLALMLGKELKLSRDEIALLGQAALFHDVGLSSVPDAIRLKSESLTPAEQAIYEQHCEKSVLACKNAGLSSDIITIVAQHHELCDGSGYPHKLQQKDIHPLARVLSLVDHFDDMCNRPSPSDSHTPHEALALMFSQQRAKYDALPLNTFIRCMGVYPPGSVVMLSNEAFAMVVSVNSTRPLKPQVLVYVPGTPSNETPLIDLEKENNLNISKSLKPSQLPREAMECLNPRKRMTYFFAPKDND